MKLNPKGIENYELKIKRSPEYEKTIKEMQESIQDLQITKKMKKDFLFLLNMCIERAELNSYFSGHIQGKELPEILPPNCNRERREIQRTHQKFTAHH